MRIDQILPSLGRYDAIGNDVRLMQGLLQHEGFESDIFTDLGHTEGETRHFREYRKYASKDNIVIHHYSVGSDIPYHLLDCSSFKVTRYHNITPAQYFTTIPSSEAFFRCLEGRQQFPVVRGDSQAFWATSKFNAEELRKVGFKRGSVLPVLRRYDALSEHKQSARLASWLKMGNKKTLLYVARVMPHKGHHDAIFLLNLYKKYVNKNVRLIFVGSGETDYVEKQLAKLLDDLGLSSTLRGVRGPGDLLDSDVIFAGTTTEDELAAYYRHAHVYLSYSEHEGFCVPLVEAMFFGIPILAHNATAVPETVGNAAILVDKEDVVSTVGALYKLLNDRATRESCSTNGRAKAEEFRWPKLKETFLSSLRDILALHGNHQRSVK